MNESIDGSVIRLIDDGCGLLQTILKRAVRRRMTMMMGQSLVAPIRGRIVVIIIIIIIVTLIVALVVVVTALPVQCAVVPLLSLCCTTGE